MTPDDTLFLALTCTVAIAITVAVLRWGRVLVEPARRR